MNDSVEKFLKYLENPIIAFSVFFVFMLVVGVALPFYWILLFSVVWGYVLSDIFINGFIAGGRGIAQIPLSRDHLAKHKGHAYVAFFIGIIISTLVAGAISDYILELTKSNRSWFIWVLGWSFFACLAVFADLEARFYNRD